MTTKQEIVKLLETNDKAVCRALVLLNERQTADEQATEQTRYHNGRGFRPCHAVMGTSMAKQIARKGRLELSEKQISYWRKKMACGNMRIGIYAGQLLEEAQAKAAKAPKKDIEQERLEIQVAEVMDSDDEKMISAAQTELDAYMERIQNKK